MLTAPIQPRRDHHPLNLELIGLVVAAWGSLAAPAAAATQETGLPLEPGFNKIFEARAGPLVAAHEGAGASVVVVRGAEIVHASSTGASAVYELHPIGSVTGALTATVCVELHELGLLPLDEPIPRLMGLEGEAAAALAETTPRHLLAHTAGLPFDVDAALDVDADIVAALLAGEPLGAPGSEYRYSRVGYALVGKLMRRASTRSYRDLLVGYLTSQLGMEETRIDESPERVVYAPADGILSTPLELARFVSLQLLPVSQRQTGAPVPAYVVCEVQRPQLVDGAQESRSLGWRVSESEGALILMRTDRTGDDSTFMAFAPRHKIGLVLTGHGVGDLEEPGTSLLAAALELSPTRATLELIADGHLVEALPGLERFCRDYPDDGFGWYWYATARLDEGLPEKALAPMQRAWDLGFQPLETSYALARANALLGRADEAFGWLDESFRNGLRADGALATDEAFAALRTDPRFGALGDR